MNANLQSYVVRTVQKTFIDAFSLDVRVVMEGQKFNPGDDEEYVELYVRGPEMQPANGSVLIGALSVDAVCTVPRTADAHRIDEVTGAAMAALHGKTVQLMDYPAATPAQAFGGWIRLFDAKSTPRPLTDSHAYGGGDEVPVRQVNVSVEGKVELTA